MRILIDLQAAQTEASGRRGVGRYSVSLAKAMAQRSRGHEVWLAINERFSAAADTIRAEFRDLIPSTHIRTFDVPQQASHASAENIWRRRTGELLRESFLADLKPDFVYVSSLFEGLGEDAVTSINRLSQPFSTGVTLYDLIPLMMPEAYLSNEAVKHWYYDKLMSLKRADMLFAISESSRRDALNHLSLPSRRVTNISCAVDPSFQVREINPAFAIDIKKRHGIHNKFVMYTGGIDHRKNIEGLIKSWALVGEDLRSTHQLAIVCSIHQADRSRLEELTSSLGLEDSDVVFTGYISESDLVSFYNICDLFVFPSLYEGFGLPILEAMACGAPTIGANNSSIIEVLNFKDAMFDGSSIEAIAKKISDTLRSADFRNALVAHGQQQARKFSWQTCAELALDAIERAVEQDQPRKSNIHVNGVRKPLLAFISPLPPLETGIADYSAELLRELVRNYEVEVVTDQATISDPWIDSALPVLNVDDFKKSAHKFDRILYHFGNSDFHTYMFDLLYQYPGVVVLHDLFLSGVQAWREHHHRKTAHFTRALALSHGYSALIDHIESKSDAAIWTYPINQEVVEAAKGVIVHSRFSYHHLLQTRVEEDALAYIPLLRAAVHPNRSGARQQIDLDDGQLLICSFGAVGKNKNSLLLLEGFRKYVASGRSDVKLVFVGGVGGDSYAEEFKRFISDNDLERQVSITGYVEPSIYKSYLAAADVAIQLRAFTRGETSAAALDCLAYGIPTIVNAHGPMAELDDGAVIKLAECPSALEIASAFEHLLDHPAAREKLSQNALALVREVHAPHKIGDLYAQAIEAFHASSPGSRYEAVLQMMKLDPHFHLAGAEDIAHACSCLDRNLPIGRQHKLFVDVSELVTRDWQSGIQRVVKSILFELLRDPPAGLYVEPVYGHVDEDGFVYRSARRFTTEFIGHADDLWADEVIEPANGDTFLGLDLAPILVPRMAFNGMYSRWRARGVRIHFVIYDLLPVLHPEFFSSGAAENFSAWLDAVAECADGVMCISHSVAQEFTAYVGSASCPHERDLNVNWFHLGSDVVVSDSSEVDVNRTELAQFGLTDKPFVVMVGTLEPRKGHRDIIDAFDKLWKQGANTSLVIVGRRGWLADELISVIEGHHLIGKQLFWFSDVDDAKLEHFYAQADGLIAASYAEGYGLPLIEAAKRGVPIFARSIPVFREVAGRYATYFDESGRFLVKELGDWIKSLEANVAVRPEGMLILSWAESTEKLISGVFEENRVVGADSQAL
ncbi:MAG: glycosyltransferase [Methylobacterium sp.]|uniref:glycosyltransferase n=1 Tax=Methylobacterium sp. TaxID=409 RepID=UPI0025D7D782|nr:glycosyltransferase [Methylobacterium sp.]MBX9933025.1 glycosyltransferase [Methylobacterium sp.]